MRFTLEIELGNEAMQTPNDVRDAIVRSLSHEGYQHEPFNVGNDMVITDSNGNAVGSWEVIEPMYLTSSDGTIIDPQPKYERRGLTDMRRDLGRVPTAQEWADERR